MQTEHMLRFGFTNVMCDAKKFPDCDSFSRWFKREVFVQSRTELFEILFLYIPIVIALIEKICFMNWACFFSLLVICEYKMMKTNFQQFLNICIIIY